VAEFKYEGRRNLAPLLAELSARPFRRLLDDAGLSATETLVSWIPAHSSSIRSRGYNQAEVLARALSHRMSMRPATPLIRKVTRTRHQQALGRAERQINLRRAFRPLAPPSAAHGAKGLVLVDDVYTTGATAQEAADVVVRALGLPVYVFTFCRTVDSGDGSIV
jgi:predicted amidophosphoribosyltransferase